MVASNTYEPYNANCCTVGSWPFVHSYFQCNSWSAFIVFKIHAAKFLQHGMEEELFDIKLPTFCAGERGSPVDPLLLFRVAGRCRGGRTGAARDNARTSGDVGVLRNV